MPRRFADAMAIHPQAWRNHLLAVILRASVVVGLLVYPPSLFFVLQRGYYGVAVVDTLALLAILCLFWADRCPYRWRAGGLCFIGYALGTALLTAVGSISQIYLFAFSILATLLLGMRAGMFSVALNSATMLTIGLLGGAAREMTIPDSSGGVVEWTVITLNFGLINALMALAVGAVLAGVEGALVREIAAHASLGQERRLQRTLIDALPDIIYAKDANCRFVICNPAALAYFGFEKEEDLLGKSGRDVVPAGHSGPLRADDLQVLGGASILNREEPGVGPNAARLYLTTKVPLRDPDGNVVGLVGIQADVTEQRRLEDALHQSQKMQAIGQLAGGVAHDFNNLLTVITGYCDLLLSMMPETDRRRDAVEQILRAGERAAGLTAQLLAFSRKTVLEPKVLDPNAVIGDMEKMLKRLIGEDIVLTTVLNSGIGKVRVDPNQLGQILMNLAVNARDAMPKGGNLTIETASIDLDEAYLRRHPEAAAGPAVRISVADTGIGMDPEVKARIFEPFFTTKGLGRGTGLGLAVVHGIIRQSGGHVEVYSELGMGTTFKLYLPALDPPTPAAPMPEQMDLRGTETILLVEDEDGVREMAAVVLRSYGYTVLASSTGGAALEIMEQRSAGVDLLVTDVVMPAMDGRELARKLQARFPTLKALYVSGYTDDAVVRHGVLREEMAFLQKPFTLLGLARKVRQLLDAPKNAPKP